MNRIICIIFLIIGTFCLFFIGKCIYKQYYNKDDDYTIPIIIFTFFSLLFIITPIIHWNDDYFYKTIECKEYHIETKITYSQAIDTTYIIHYK